MIVAVVAPAGGGGVAVDFHKTLGLGVEVEPNRVNSRVFHG